MYNWYNHYKIHDNVEDWLVILVIKNGSIKDQDIAFVDYTMCIWISKDGIQKIVYDINQREQNDEFKNILKRIHSFEEIMNKGMNEWRRSNMNCKVPI